MRKLVLTGAWRSRWAAMGAAVAVALGGGSIGLASAAGPNHPGVTVSIQPCRLVDTRPGSGHVGPRTSPLGVGDTYRFVARGPVGQCNVPGDAVGLVMNVTIANPTAASFLTVYPGDGARPLASSLNWSAGQSPTPNQVTSRLGADGSVAFFNSAGTVDLIVDVVGYLADSDSRYASSTQTLVLDAYSGAATTGVTPNLYGCLQFDPAAMSSVSLNFPLPAGALISAVTVRSFDLSGDGSIQITLRNANFVAGKPGGETLASEVYQTPNSLGAVERLVLKPQTRISDRHSVHLLAIAPAHTNELDFCGASVTYTMSP